MSQTKAKAGIFALELLAFESLVSGVQGRIMDAAFAKMAASQAAQSRQDDPKEA